METNQALTVIDDSAGQLMRRATDVAGLCKAIVLKSTCDIQGHKYIKSEGWMAIATAHGCIASSRDVEKIEGGYRAIGEIKRISDGAVLSQAEGFVGMDETKTWGSRPEYACRAMAQTRAISRACRAAFAHVVVLMDAGLSTTPADEVPPGGFDDKGQRQPPHPPAGFTKTGPPQQAGQEYQDEAVVTEVTEASSPAGAPKAWLAFFGKFSRENNTTFDAVTFDKKIGAQLVALKASGVRVKVVTKPGRKEGKLDIVSITEVTTKDELPM